MHGRLKSNQILVKKTKNYINAALLKIGTTFSTNIVLDTKVHNSASWNILNLGLSNNSSTLDMSVNDILKYIEKVNLMASGQN